MQRRNSPNRVSIGICTATGAHQTGGILALDRAHRHFDRLLKSSENHLGRFLSGVIEFLRTISLVAGAGDDRAHVMVEVARQVKDEVADAVAERERLDPGFLLRHATYGTFHRAARWRR